MTDYRTLLQRDLGRVGPAGFTFEDVARRRDRKRRRQRLAAGVLGTTLFVAAVWVVSDVASLDDTRTSVAPGGAATDPFVSIRSQLTGDTTARDLFTVRADHAEYWRMYTLDRFNGESWTGSDLDGSFGRPVELPGPLGPTGGTVPPGAKSLVQTVRILGDIPGPDALPMAQTPVEISHSSFPGVAWDPERSQAFANGDLEPGMEYTVRSRIVVPTAQELDGLRFLSPGGYGSWTQLPADLDPRITRIAENWTAGAASGYEKVLDVMQHFRDPKFGFVYSTDVAPATGQDALLDFLTNTKVGFCQHYASAMAVLVRSLGLPARVAVGYREGELRDDGSFLVSAADANAWVEVLFPTYGWLPFDPTPGHGSLPNASPGSYLNPAGA